MTVDKSRIAAILEAARARKTTLTESSQLPEPVQEKPKAITNHLAAIAAKAQEDKKTHEVIFKELPMDFQSLLDNFDSLVSQSVDVDVFTIDTARAYVSRIMKDLQSNPEYEGLFLDRDTHNVIKTVRTFKSLAQEEIVTKQTKQTKASAKKQIANNRFSKIMDMDFDLMDIQSPADLANKKL